ncbi:ysgA [Symbiodinium sp. CCMP2592]|nr:ysgA [Symbiodinium sp. CCMP2592]
MVSVRYRVALAGAVTLLLADATSLSALVVCPLHLVVKRPRIGRVQLRAVLPKAAEIQSKRSNAYKLLRKLATRAGRSKLGRFLAEGDTFLRMRPRTVVVRQSRYDDGGLQEIVEAVLSASEAGPPRVAPPLTWGGGLKADTGHPDVAPGFAVLSNGLFDQLSTQEKSQGVLCVFGLPRPSTAQALGESVVVLDGVEDPNNLGVILRTMEAFGSKTLVLTKGTVDVFNPKVVRCSMGAVVRGRIDVLEVAAAEELRQLLQGYRIFATTLEGRCLSTQLAAELTGRDAFVTLGQIWERSPWRLRRRDPHGRQATSDSHGSRRGLAERRCGGGRGTSHGLSCQ